MQAASICKIIKRELDPIKVQIEMNELALNPKNLLHANKKQHGKNKKRMCSVMENNNTEVCPLLYINELFAEPQNNYKRTHNL